MRLIDADRLKEAIHTDFSEHYTLYHDTDQTALFDMVMDDIDEIPTAFDKEKVIEELKSWEKASHDAGIQSTYAELDNKASGYYQESRAYHRAIEIIEKGGIE
mgnify:CR=1 FL=1